MNKHDAAVLKALRTRMRSYMREWDLKTYDAVIASQRGKQTPAANLLRACARWMKATS